MSLFTNGLEPTIVMEKVQGILALPNYKSLSRLTVSISLDGYGDMHQKIRRFPQAFERATETIKRLKGLQHKAPFHLCSTCVVQPLNVDNLVQLAEFTRELGLPISFIPIRVPDCYVEDIANEPPLRFTHQDLAKLKIILDHQMQPNLPLSNAISWREYFKIAGGEKRRLPCFLAHHTAGVDSDGSLYSMCTADSSLVYGNVREEPPDKIWYSQKAKEIRKRVERYSCPKCTVCCNTAFSLREEFFYAAGFLLKEKGKKLFGK
jgi:MoaA/NifB/PqqE/SkfB family radical SAM enzyme